VKSSLRYISFCRWYGWQFSDIGLPLSETVRTCPNPRFSPLPRSWWLTDTPNSSTTSQLHRQLKVVSSPVMTKRHLYLCDLRRRCGAERQHNQILQCHIPRLTVVFWRCQPMKTGRLSYGRIINWDDAKLPGDLRRCCWCLTAYSPGEGYL
jgi:hypothetical protein